MKKLLFVLAIGAFAACNSGTSSDASADSARRADSLKKVEDSAAEAQKAAVNAAGDSATAKIDSAADAKKAQIDSTKAPK
jgi:hypothetical protein